MSADKVLEINKESIENLSDDQFNNIAEEAMREMEEERGSGKAKKQEEIIDEEIVEEAEEEQEEPKEEENKEEVKEEKKEEPAKEENKEEKPKEEAVKSQEIDEKTINDYALKHDLTIEEAKEDLAKNKALLSRFKTPEEMARAMRIIQSERDKLAAEREKVAKEQPKERAIVSRETFKAELSEHIETNRDKILENYRKHFPAKYEVLTEEAILEEVSDKIMTAWEQHVQKLEIEKKSQAASKREEVLASIQKEEPNFYADVKAVINKTDDNQILSEGFDVKDIVRWAKGGRYAEDVKAAEERGYRRGKEEAKVIGEVVQTPSKSAPASKPVQSVKLNDEQKERALQMFEGLQMTDEDKFKSYYDMYSEKLKKDPNYLG